MWKGSNGRLGPWALVDSGLGRACKGGGWCRGCSWVIRSGLERVKQ